MRVGAQVVGATFHRSERRAGGECSRYELQSLRQMLLSRCRGRIQMEAGRCRIRFDQPSEQCLSSVAKNWRDVVRVRPRIRSRRRTARRTMPLLPAEMSWKWNSFGGLDNRVDVIAIEVDVRRGSRSAKSVDALAANDCDWA